MKKTEPSIRNRFNEKLDTWVEELEGYIKATVILVHGFGTSKHETAGYFDDITTALVNDNYRVVRFDLSGYGNSEGREEDGCYTKHAKDVETICDWVRSSYAGEVYILAQSMGCWITSLANPGGISKTLMTGIPNHNTQIVIERIKGRFGSRPGARLDMDGISLLPRSTGKIQKIGSQFWKDIKSFKPLETIEQYAQRTKLLIIHWKQDEIIGNDYINEYDNLPGVKAAYLDGDHSLTNKNDRDNFLKKMLEFFNE